MVLIGEKNKKIYKKKRLITYKIGEKQRLKKVAGIQFQRILPVQKGNLFNNCNRLYHFY